MSLSSQNPEDSLKKLIRDKFEEFEPDAPDRLEFVLGQLPKQPESQISRTTGRIFLVAFLVLLTHSPIVDFPVSENIPPDLFSSDDAVEGNVALEEEEFAVFHSRGISEAQELLPVENNSEAVAVDPVSSDIVSVPHRLPTEIPGELLSLREPALPATMPSRAIVNTRDEISEEKALVPVKRSGEVLFMGGIGLHNTQYRVTLLPQENVSVMDLTMPGVWSRISWRPQGYVGADYKNWQLLVSWRQFAQQLDYQLANGTAEVSYDGETDYKVKMLGSSESKRSDFRYIGLNLRKSMFLKRAPFSYVGVGGGYHIELSGKDQSIWGQVFVGREIPLDEHFRVFVEGQLQYSFGQLNQPGRGYMYSKPYQAGLTAGIRWGR